MIPYDSETLRATIFQYNLDIWPAHIPALLILLLLLGQVFKKTSGSGRIASAILSTLWFWVAIFYFLQTYSDLNWFGLWLAEIFTFQGFLILLRGVVLNHLQFDLVSWQSGLPGFFWLTLVLIVAPAMQTYFNDNYLQADYFSLQPDQLVALTLVFLLHFSPTTRWYMLVIPVLWVFYSLSWSLMLGDASRIVLPLASFAIVLINCLNFVFARRKPLVSP